MLRQLWAGGQPEFCAWNGRSLSLNLAIFAAHHARRTFIATGNTVLRD